MQLSPEVTRAATALRAEGKELAHVLSQLRQRCGGKLLRAASGREVRLRMSVPRTSSSLAQGNALRTTVFRLANTAGLRRAEVRSWQDGVQVVYLEEYPPPLDHPDLPPKLYAHASALHEAINGHHERAVSFFSLLASHVMGPGVRCAIDRPRHLPPAGRPAADQPGGGPGGGLASADGGGSIYPSVPRLELRSGGQWGAAAPRGGVLSLAQSGAPVPQPALD